MLLLTHMYHDNTQGFKFTDLPLEIIIVVDVHRLLVEYWAMELIPGAVYVKRFFFLCLFSLVQFPDSTLRLFEWSLGTRLYRSFSISMDILECQHGYTGMPAWIYRSASMDILECQHGYTGMPAWIYRSASMDILECQHGYTGMLA